MKNNDILRRLRYALDISDVKMIEIFGKSNFNVNKDEIRNMLKKEDEEGFYNVNDRIMTLFLDGFVIFKRGDNPKKEEIKKEKKLTNNEILKKIKIALSLKTEDILELMELAESPISKSELGAVLQKKDHKNYKECGDKYIKKLLQGLTIKFRNN
ncbi:MAG: DUF1456 family protein [Fusobacteriaceae bacterium]|nr:DUF1456 family protein [Fusobacteriaceae bacterium]MBN2837774.1 DUF1456 family protein [Fusobacteriaceae bacterium]